MEWIGLLVEFILLAIGVYFYLFAIGKVESKSKEQAAKMETFRKQNGTWLRILSLCLISMMLINIFLHLRQLL